MQHGAILSGRSRGVNERFLWSDTRVSARPTFGADRSLNLLDENFPADQKLLLINWGFPVRKIGSEVSPLGRKRSREHPTTPPNPACDFLHTGQRLCQPNTMSRRLLFG